MQLPPENSAARVRVKFGRYVQAKLKRAQLGELAQTVRAATDRLKQAARDDEDQEEAETMARADRDGVDDIGDEAVQNVRNQLAGRSVRAMREEPYTIIFAEGVDHYIAAPLDEVDGRLGLLTARLERNLPADDPALAPTLAAIAQVRTDWKKAVDELATERTKGTLTGDALASATEAWERQLEKTYGALIERFGRRRAERFFPRTRRGEVVDEPTPTPAAPPAPADGPMD